ncbi:MAG: hypothetical protein HFI04_09205 [Lachnospiraceae bacterium]|jgi:hypothetical protein|nr:hypothetical protein [Lachnospiraceae bacterium]
MSPFLRGGEEGRKGSGAVGWWGEAMGGDGKPAGQQGVGQPGSRSRWGGGGDVLAGASNRISLMKWGYIVKPIGAETTGILPCVS